MSSNEVLSTSIVSLLNDCYKDLRSPQQVLFNEPKQTPNPDFLRFLNQFQDMCDTFKAAFNPKTNIQAEQEMVIGKQILQKLDHLVTVNNKINLNLERVSTELTKSQSPLQFKSSHSLGSIETEASKQYFSGKEDKTQFSKLFYDSPREPEEKKSPMIVNKASQLEIIEQFSLPENIVTTVLTASTPLFAANSIRMQTEIEREWIDGSHKDLIFHATKEVGQAYIDDAEYYFKQYSTARLNYDDMKIKFSESMLRRIIDKNSSWVEYYERRKTEGNPIQVEAFSILDVFDKSAKETLTFLINKYPPSRRRIIDTELTEKIKEKKFCSVAKYDILKNSGVPIGMDEDQTDFTKDIKLFLNALIKETRKEFPLFKQTMKGIFSNHEGSMDGSKTGSEVDFSICSKISSSAELYSEEEISRPGLDIKNSEILRILMKWCEDLLDYFLDTDQKILKNKFGFKTTQYEGIPIKIPHSKKKKLAGNLEEIYNNELKLAIDQHKKEMNILIFNLLKQCGEGIEGYPSLNEKELTVLKLSECLSEALRSSAMSCINILLNGLSRIRSLYSPQEVESNLHLVTFSVMDLLRCRCVGTKSEIYRIYNEIVSNTKYFEVIRVKNKLNESTRDILINLKLKNSFLICEVQLSLGESGDEVNDHFCHYLYELSRSSFGVLFECANQIWGLDPRMAYIKKNPNMKFKTRQLMKEHVLQQFRSADFLYCSDDHEEVAMTLELNDTPYCCNLCSSFHSAYKSWLIHLKCPRCYNSVCFPCFNGIKKKNQCLMSQYLREMADIRGIVNYCSMDYYYSSEANPEKMRNEIKKLLKKYQYIVYIMVNNLGRQVTIKKRYKDSFVSAFTTVMEVPMVEICEDLPYHWNGIYPLKDTVVKSLSELKKYRKVHISEKWYDIQEILERKGLTEVVCVILEEEETVLIVDIVETEKEIELFLQERDNDKHIEQYNLGSCNFFEMTSKELTDISFMDNIKNKDSLKMLSFWENNIKDISILKNFRNIEELYLKENEIESMEPLLGMRNIIFMTLSNNMISGELPLLNFPYLQLLDISEVQLTSIEALSTSNLDSLVKLKANSMNITSVPRINMPNLTNLCLGHNQIEDIEKFSKSNLPNLIRVTLYYNKIKGKIPKLEFPNLQTLNLESNLIEDISELVSSSNLSLKTLNLSDNKIAGRIDEFNFPSLIRLDISKNKIESVGADFFASEKLNRLEYIDISNNLVGGELQRITLSSLKWIDLSHNLLTCIDNLGVSYLSRLSHVNLSDNKICEGFPTLKFSNLTHLNASFNKFSDISNLSDSKMPKLKHLNLSNNLILEVPSLQLQSLLELDVSHNRIVSFSLVECLHLISEVKEINIKGNSPIIKDLILDKKKPWKKIFKFH